MLFENGCSSVGIGFDFFAGHHEVFREVFGAVRTVERHHFFTEGNGGFVVFATLLHNTTNIVYSPIHPPIYIHSIPSTPPIFIFPKAL